MWQDPCWFCYLKRSVLVAKLKVRHLWYSHLISVGMVMAHIYDPPCHGCRLCRLPIRDWPMIPACSGKDLPWCYEATVHGELVRMYQKED